MDNSAMLFLYDTILRGAVKDYYEACSTNNLEEMEELKKWFMNTEWVGVFCGLHGINVETLLEKTENLALKR